MKFTHLHLTNVQIYTLNCQQQSFKLQNSVLFLLMAFEKLEMLGKWFVFELSNKGGLNCYKQVFLEYITLEQLIYKLVICFNNFSIT